MLDLNCSSWSSFFSCFSFPFYFLQRYLSILVLNFSSTVIFFIANCSILFLHCSCPPALLHFQSLEESCPFLSLSRSFSPSAEPTALKWGLKHLEFLGWNKPHWSSRGGPVSSESPSPFLNDSCFSHLLSSHFLSCLRLGSLGKWNRNWHTGNIWACPQDQPWGEGEGSRNGQMRRRIAMHLHQRLHLISKDSFWSWKGPPVIPLWGEGAGVLSSPPHCQLLNEAYSGWRVCVLSRFSHIQLFATLWTVTHQAPLSMEFSRQGYWSGLPCPPPGDLPSPGIEPASLNVSCIFGRPVLYH